MESAGAATAGTPRTAASTRRPTGFEPGGALVTRNSTIFSPFLNKPSPTSAGSGGSVLNAPVNDTPVDVPLMMMSSPPLSALAKPLMPAREASTPSGITTVMRNRYCPGGPFELVPATPIHLDWAELPIQGGIGNAASLTT